MGQAIERGRLSSGALVISGDVHAADEEICSYAREDGYVILTNDLDFPQILAHTGDSGPSVLVLRGEPLTPEARGVALLAALLIVNRNCFREPS